MSVRFPRMHKGKRRGNGVSKDIFFPLKVKGLGYSSLTEAGFLSGRERPMTITLVKEKETHLLPAVLFMLFYLFIVICEVLFICFLALLEYNSQKFYFVCTLCTHY